MKASHRWFSNIGILVAVFCFWIATRLYPGGYNWNRDFISTLLRGQSPASRLFAIAGLFCFCVCIATVFARLSKAIEPSMSSKAIRIGGIGSMVYASLAFTPLHDLVVTISLLFFLVAAAALMKPLLLMREMVYLAMGGACFLVLVVSAAIYYSQSFPDSPIHPWAQRICFVLYTSWLVALDNRFNRMQAQQPISD